MENLVVNFLEWLAHNEGVGFLKEFLLVYKTYVLSLGWAFLVCLPVVPLASFLRLAKEKRNVEKLGKYFGEMKNQKEKEERYHFEEIFYLFVFGMVCLPELYVQMWVLKEIKVGGSMIWPDFFASYKGVLLIILRMVGAGAGFLIGFLFFDSGGFSILRRKRKTTD